MEIILKKGSGQEDLSRGKSYKKSTMHITRDDGSKDWTYLHPGLLDHDIAHYAVESVLKMDNGFFGIINKGAAIADFEKPKEDKGPLVHPETMHIEAQQSEYIVNQLQIELYSSGKMDDFLEVLRNTLDVNGFPFPEQLNDQSLKEIRAMYYKHALEFLSMPEGSTLNLSF